MSKDEADLPADYVALAKKMPAVVRALIVDNAAVEEVRANDVLRALGLPEISERPKSRYPGLRSLELLRMLPSQSGTAADFEHVDHALSADACAAVRAAVDAASFGAADSVDGCIDYQLNLSRVELEELVGKAAVAHLWQLAVVAVRRERGNDSAVAELEAHEIFARRYTPNTRPWFPFHKDRSEVTVNIAVSSDAEHDGGRLLCLCDGEVRRIERGLGCATIHPSSLFHAVTRMTAGARYSLIVFFGRCEKIVAFNEAVRKQLGAPRTPTTMAEEGEQVNGSSPGPMLAT